VEPHPSRVRLPPDEKSGNVSAMNVVMRWWRRFRGVGRRGGIDETPSVSDRNVTRLPEDPYVFECRTCGKVFEARRRHPLCRECDSADVELMSE